MTDNIFARRAIVTGLGIGAAAFGTGLAACASAEEKPAPAMAAAAAPPAPARWQPTYEPEDDWMELPGRHRYIFDADSPEGAGQSLFFANNYIVANKDGYNIKPSELATIIVLRHFATPFGYNDAIWKKYGAEAGKLLKYKDPKTKKIAMRNTLMAAPESKKPSDEAVSIPILVGKNVHFAICGAATKFFAGYLAKNTGGKEDDIYAELAANLVPNSHMVPAGVVAVNRAQERGYAFAYVG